MSLLNSDFKRIYDYLNDIDFKYRSKLNVLEDTPFGLELQFNTYRGIDLKHYIKQYNKKHTFDKKIINYNDDEIIHQKTNDNICFDVKLPVLKNNEGDFNLLKEICDSLDLINNHNMSKKGMHLHTNLSILEENNDDLILFLKIITLYEHVLFRFSYGNDLNSNIDLDNYSREISRKIYDYIKNEECSEDFYSNIANLRKILNCKSYALNFHESDNNVKKDTIEFRNFNSTTDSVIVQNNINLVFNLFNSVKNNELDRDYIDYKLGDYEYSLYDKNNYDGLFLEDAIEFSDLIFSTSTDKEYFLRQYLVKEPKQKKLVI